MNHDDHILDPAFDPRIADWLEADPDRAPREVLDTVLAAMPSIPQRRVSYGAPWRLSHMLTPSRAAIAAVLGVVLVGGAFLISQRPAPAAIGGSSPSPSVATSSPSASRSAVPLGLATVGLDGSVRQELGLPQDAWMADLSPAGDRVAFLTSSKDLGFCGGCGRGLRIAIVDIAPRSSGYVLGPDVTEVANLAWSPDGSRIAFSDTAGLFNRDIYVLDLQDDGDSFGGEVRRLTTDPAEDQFPAWSADGSTIFYDSAGSEALDSSGFSPTQEIWKVSAAGGDPTRLTDNDIADSMPDARVDGTVAYWDAGEIWTMASDGTGQAPLGAVPPEAGFNPRWSPDGTKVALLRYDGSGRAHLPGELGHPTDLPRMEVIVVDIDSGQVSDLGTSVASDVNPVSWTADGQALLINRYD